MNHQRHTTRSNPEHRNGGQARSRWWAAGLAGATGLALTAAAVTTLTAAPGGEGVGHAAVVDDQLGQPKGTRVPCDTSRLIAEISVRPAQAIEVITVRLQLGNALGATGLREAA